MEILHGVWWKVPLNLLISAIATIITSYEGIQPIRNGAKLSTPFRRNVPSWVGLPSSSWCNYEAGEGEEGQMKSAIGIGSLLTDAIGDTIRVSLTEDPQLGYEPCNQLAEIVSECVASTNAKAKAPQEAAKKYVDT